MALAFRAAQSDQQDAIAQTFPDPEPLMTTEDDGFDRSKWWGPDAA